MRVSDCEVNKKPKFCGIKGLIPWPGGEILEHLDNIQSLYVYFIKIASENPFLWTGMKDASAESRKMWYMKLDEYPKSCSRCLRYKISRGMGAEISEMG